MEQEDFRGHLMDFLRCASTKHRILYGGTLGLVVIAIIGSFSGIFLMELLAAVGIFVLARHA